MGTLGPVPPRGTRRGGALEDLERGARSDYFDLPRHDWRREVRTASGLNIVAGAWLVLSPWTIGFAGEDPVWSAVIGGGLVAAMALLRVAGMLRQSGFSLVNATIGVWTFVTAFWLYDTTAAAWNALIVGMVITLLALWSVAATETRPAALGRNGGPRPGLR